ncbi:hypothetical protein ACO1KZ_15585, partial [Staphylococcus aureus]
KETSVRGGMGRLPARDALAQGLAGKVGDGGELAELNPTRCIDDEKISSIHFAKSGSDWLTSTRAGGGGGTRTWVCATETDGAGELAQA